MLPEEKRTQLDSIVQQMVQNKEPDENISAVVSDFKQKYTSTNPEEGNNFLQNLVMQPLKTLVARPAIRLVQAGVGAGVKAFAGEEANNNYDKAISQPTDLNIPLLGSMRIDPMKDFGKGGASQIVGDTLDTASYLVPAERAASIGSSLVKGEIKKAAVGGAVSGFQYGALSGAGEGFKADNADISSIAKSTAWGAGTGTVAGTVLGAGGAKLLGNMNKGAQINNLEQKYNEWAGLTKPGVKMINKAENRTEALDMSGTVGRTPQKVLAESGVVPKTEGTKFRTIEQADDFRNQTTKLRDANREALKEVEMKVPKVNLLNEEEKAVAIARSPQNIANNSADDLEREIRGEYATYRKNYGDEITLTQYDDIKSAKWGKTPFNMTKPLQGSVNYIIGKTAQTTIVNTAEGVGMKDVAQMNREIGDRLEAAKFLEGLDGNTVKGGRLTKLFIAGIGSTLGHTIPGKIIGALGGEVVADVFMKLSVNSPLRALILRGIKNKDPKSFEIINDWIKTQGENRFKGVTETLSLPAGKQGAPRSQVGGSAPIPIVPRGRNIELPTQPVVGGVNTPTNAPTGRAKGTPIEMMAGEQYTPPSELPSIQMGDRKAQISSLLEAQGVPKVFIPELVQKLISEPYIPTDKLPVIKAGKGNSKKSNLPSIKY
jgi:hypothetical protein